MELFSRGLSAPAGADHEGLFAFLLHRCPDLDEAMVPESQPLPKKRAVRKKASLVQAAAPSDADRIMVELFSIKSHLGGLDNAIGGLGTQVSCA